MNFTDIEHRFKHCMSLVEFKIKPGQGVKYNNYKLNCLDLKGIFTSGKFDTRTGSVETIGDRATLTRVLKAKKVLLISCCRKALKAIRWI